MRRLLPVLLFCLGMLAHSRPAQAQLMYGVDVNLHIKTNQGHEGQLLDAARQLGVGWMRLGWGFGWKHVEPQPGQWRWQLSDRVLDALQSHHIHLLCELGAPPDWAYAGESPLDAEGFAVYAGAVAARYRGRIGAYKILNEPQNITAWTPHAYARLVALTARAIHAADPQAIVMAGGFWFTPKASAWQKAAFEDLEFPLGRSIDVFNIHMTRTSLQAAARWLQQAHREMIAEDVQLPIWVDEFAYASQPEEQFMSGLQKGEASQVEFLRQMVRTISRDPDVKAVFWTYLSDNFRARKPEERWLGLLHGDFTPKPAFTAYQVLISSQP